MSRRVALISFAIVGLLLVATTLVMMFRKGCCNVTVSFVNAEPSHGEFPLYQESERLAFAIRNAGAEPASIEVYGLDDEHGNWVPLLRKIGDVETHGNTQLYFYLPQGSHPRNLRVRVNEKASALQKTQFALKLLIGKASGSYTGTQVWFPGLRLPRGEFVVSLENDVGPNRGANGRQP